MSGSPVTGCACRSQRPDESCGPGSGLLHSWARLWGSLARARVGLGVLLALCPPPASISTPSPLCLSLPGRPHRQLCLCFPRFWKLSGPIRGPELLSPMGLLHPNNSSPSKTYCLAGGSLPQNALSRTPLHPPGTFEEYLPSRDFILTHPHTDLKQCWAPPHCSLRQKGASVRPVLYLKISYFLQPLSIFCVSFHFKKYCIQI